MKNALLVCLFVVQILIFIPSIALTATDQYPGDTSIYGTVTSTIQPNILFLIDTSGSMNDPVPGTAGSYLPSFQYSTYAGCESSQDQTCNTNGVYQIATSRRGGTYYKLVISDVDLVSTSCGTANPQNLLKTVGVYTGKSLIITGGSAGGCITSGSTTGTYYLGNMLNWTLSGGATTNRSKIEISRDVLSKLVASTSGVKFGLMKFGAGSHGGTFLTDGTTGYVTSVQNLEETVSGVAGTTTKREAFINAISTLTADGSTPLGEQMFEAMRYFKGQASAFSSTVGTDSITGLYSTPIEAQCQKNYIVIISDGESNNDTTNVLDTLCTHGDCDNDGAEPANVRNGRSTTKAWNHIVDDIAKYMYEHDMSDGSVSSVRNVTTFAIGFNLNDTTNASLVAASALLKRTIDGSHGRGEYFDATDQISLEQSLTQVVSNVLQVNTSFVAPVVPVSPENRTFGASRVYIGLFKPINGGTWLGNLKKFGFDRNNSLLDSSGSYATYVDVNSDRVDDRPPYVNLPITAISGSFVSGCSSYWSSGDGGDVAKGGIGENILAQSTRNIYTYMGTNSLLTHSSNSFSTANTAITIARLNTTAGDRDNLINFIRGYDTYGGNPTAHREWLLGDILHSKPLVVNFATYSMTPSTNESDPTKNKTRIYIGSNDGMLHSIKDSDGTEEWAFVPPNVLPNLKVLNSGKHSNFVDSSAQVYMYDANNNGTIESGDKVILVVGQRRGSASLTTTGSYYALDVSDPTSPVFLWEINNNTTGFSELAESWSEPKIVRVKDGSSFKIAAIFGAGYDNNNEDSRYGNTQTYTGDGIVSNTSTGIGGNTSLGSSAPYLPKGRGIFAVEIATLSSTGVPIFTNSGSKLWSYTNSDNANMRFSFPAEIATLDTKGRGYIDTIYAVDMASNLWRFNVGTGSTSTWSGRQVFRSNDLTVNAGDLGRKTFYKPAVTLEPGYDLIVYGTGDREHPQNLNVTDRIYAIKSFNSDTNATAVKTEGDLIDVTANLLQSTTATSGANTISSILSSLNSSAGWFIKLNENSGEKVLSPTTIFNKVIYLTSFSPLGTITNSDPCSPANLGASKLWALNYKTGEAAHNYSTTNDSGTAPNSRSVLGSNSILLRDDRNKTIGSGIASGVVVTTSASGVSNAIVGVGGNIQRENVNKGGLVKSLYWRQK